MDKWLYNALTAFLQPCNLNDSFSFQYVPGLYMRLLYSGLSLHAALSTFVFRSVMLAQIYCAIELAAMCLSTL